MKCKSNEGWPSGLRCKSIGADKCNGGLNQIGGFLFFGKFKHFAQTLSAVISISQKIAYKGPGPS